MSDIDYAAIRAREDEGMTATEILDSIARRYPNSALLREIVVGDPDCDRFGAADEWAANGRQGKMPPFEPTFRRIDGLLLDMGQTRTAIEVKISRSDFLRETDAKRRVWRSITDRFVYATPPGLLRPDEIPDGCGLWEVDGPSVSIVKRTKRNRDPQPIPHQVLVALAYRLKRSAALAARPAAGEETR